MGDVPPQPLSARLPRARCPCLERMTLEHEHLLYPGVSSEDHELDFCSSFNLDEKKPFKAPASASFSWLQAKSLQAQEGQQASTPGQPLAAPGGHQQCPSPMGEGAQACRRSPFL